MIRSVPGCCGLAISVLVFCTANTVGADPKNTHWAFQPVRRPATPEVKNQDWVRNPIDAFVLAELEERGIEPSPEADQHTLIRRLSLDLLGLPPTPTAVEEFVTDDRPDAYGLLLDRLLASQHFGERWGRHWLDLARYADSDGYEKDSARPYAWRYRNWVIDAFNRDLPFDRFTIEQLAGDLLPGASLEQKMATGLHRNTLTNREGGVDKEEFRVKAVVDRVNTTGTIWLGLTVGCAQCHSHKYDPLTQREYYELFSFFNTADEADIPAPLPEELKRYQKAKKLFDQEHARLEAAVRDYEKKVQAGPLPDHVAEIFSSAPEKRTDKQKAQLDEYYRSIDPELAKLRGQLAEHAKKAPPYPATKAQTMVRRTEPRRTHLLIRGDFLRKGDQVQPGTPAVLHPHKPRNGRPDRVDMARWLVDQANPLTARVTVNRIWQYLFGSGLVATPEDFGTRGEPPSHPELLDWLASEFIERGWSRKAMIKLIAQSATYRQSSRTRRDLMERDPKNLLLARQNRFRVEAEIVRDLYLSASGLLHPTVGGPSIRPPLPADVAALGYANSVKWPESKGAEKYRRGMYIFVQRTVPYPMLTTFDAPDSTVACTRRERSNTPLQALTLLNDPAFFECAQALGNRIVQEAGGDTDERIQYLFRVCLARDPEPEEQSRMRELFDEMLWSALSGSADAAKLAGASDADGGKVAETAAWVALARVVLNLDEFVTRE